MAGQTEYGVIISYVIFIGVLGLFVSWGAPLILQNAPAPPAPPAQPTVDPFASLIYTIQNVGYFFLLMGITAVTYPWLGVILAAYTAAFIYMMIRLVRGGG